MHSLTTTQGIVALAAGGVAVVALLTAVVLAFRLRSMRTAQRAVLGEGDRRDLVIHAQQLEQGFTQLRDWLEESMEHMERRMGELERRIDGCIAHSALVRYDAYNELSGHQSSSLALLDSNRTGVVISSILHRDQARVYVKQLRDGESELELSPEEQEAVDAALGVPADRARA
jgi:Protein of unknown function (DUF4446)